MKWSCIHVFGVPDREGREIGAEIFFEKRITKNFLNLIIEKPIVSGSLVKSLQDK